MTNAYDEGCGYMDDAVVNEEQMDPGLPDEYFDPDDEPYFDETIKPDLDDRQDDPPYRLAESPDDIYEEQADVPEFQAESDIPFFDDSNFEPFIDDTIVPDCEKDTSEDPPYRLSEDSFYEDFAGMNDDFLNPECEKSIDPPYVLDFDEFET